MKVPVAIVPLFREREHKLAKLKKEKEEYTPGLWNSKSVMLGGLGKDPEIEGEDHSLI